MHVVADQHIPFVDALFGKYCDITQKPGETLTRNDLKTADILLVRSVTRVDTNLLAKTPVTFVGNCAAGQDHIDSHLLTSPHITVAHAAGANADTVAAYVAACLKTLQLPKAPQTIGVIGCGHIGRKVIQFFAQSPVKMLVHDPFMRNSVPLETLLQDADILTLHAPLTQAPPYPTFHMINNNNFSCTKKNLVLINTARGDLIEEQALLKHPRTLCLDVWAHEPAISLPLLEQVAIGTPHIAGLSLHAKQVATQMIFNAAANYFGWTLVPLDPCPTQPAAYDLLAQTKRFRDAFIGCKNSAEIAYVFRAQRKQFYESVFAEG